MKAKYFFYILGLTLCAFVPFEQSWTSGSGSEPVSGSSPPPSLEWGAWTIGQSKGSGDAQKTTFITNSEQTSCVKVAVKYSVQQPKTASPLTSYDFTIKMNNGFTVEKSVKSTSGPAASQLSPSTTFTVDAKMKGSGDIGKPKTCDGKNGRNNTPMKVTVTFTGTYGKDPNNQQPVSLTKTWTQDEIDLIRQEYVDMTPPDDRAELPVPGYGDFVLTIWGNGTDGWNTGHYGYMIDDGLEDKKSDWLAKVNEYRTANNLSQIADTEFQVNSAYRNPYHQRFHVNAPYTASFHSRHCYGDALDVATFDIDGDGTTEQKKLRIPRGSTAAQKAALRADAKANSDDAVELELRAKAAGAKWTASWEYYGTHTHADWTKRAWEVWPPKKGKVYSQPCEGPSGGTTSTTSTTSTGTLACAKATENSCNVLVSSASEHSVTCPRSECGVSYWSCDTDDHNLHRLRSCTNEKRPNGSFCYETWRRCQYPPKRIPNTQHFSVSPLCVTDPNGQRYCSENAVSTTPAPATTIGTTSYHACGVHETSVSGDHSNSSYTCGIHSGYLCQESSDHQVQITGYSGTFYECQPHQTYLCGHTDPTANAAYHLLQVSCSSTNSNGDSCTVTNFYDCIGHTHAYPAIVCGAASWTGCTASISSRTEHQTACSNCTESYWSCSTSGVAWHATPLTCRRSGCSVSLTKCQNTGGGGCFSNGTEYRYHDLP